MPVRVGSRSSASPALVALLVGAIAAGTASLAMAQPVRLSGTSGADRPPAAAATEHGSIRGARPASAGPGTTTTPPPGSPTSSAQPSTSRAQRTTTAPPSITRQPPSTTTPPPPATSDSGQEQRVVEYVNIARAYVGCRPVAVDRRLVEAAQWHSSDMATRRYFSHTSPEGDTFVERSRAAGYPRPAAENIAQGQRSAEQVMRHWLQSEGHRRNILNCEHTTIGVGLDTRGWYWTQVFGR